MLSAINANTERQLAELSECLKKTQNCDVVATLKQFAEGADGKVTSVDIQTVSTVSKNAVNVNEGLVHAELTEREGSINELKKIRAMWQAVLNRSTVRFLRGEANDYGINIDLICSELENGKVYTISFFNPIFMAGEDRGISFATPLDQFMYGIESVTLSEIEYEEEQLAMAKGKSGNGYSGGTYTDMDEETENGEEQNDDYTKSDFISNDDIINPLK